MIFPYIYIFISWTLQHIQYIYIYHTHTHTLYLFTPHPLPSLLEPFRLSSLKNGQNAKVPLPKLGGGPTHALVARRQSWDRIFGLVGWLCAFSGNIEIFCGMLPFFGWREMCFLALFFTPGESGKKRSHLTENWGFSHKELHLFAGFLLKKCLVHLYLEPAFDRYLIYWQLGAQPQKIGNPKIRAFSEVWNPKSTEKGVCQLMDTVCLV